MRFLDSILRKREDPTQKWKPFTAPIPDFDLTSRRFGRLQFGDGLDAAAFLGRPDTFLWTQKSYCELLYAKGGFQIDFDNGQFAYICFFIGPDDFLPQHRALTFSKPQLRGYAPDGICFTSETKTGCLERIFGAPETTDDADPDETILYYNRHHVTMEFELNGLTKRLKRWNLYPT